MKLFKNYATLSDYNADKISVSKDNLTYVQNGVTYTTDSPEGITAYNIICFVNDKKIIKKNDIDYNNGVDASKYLRNDGGNIIQVPGKKSFTYIHPNSTTYSISYRGNTYCLHQTDISCISRFESFNGSYKDKYIVINNNPSRPTPVIGLKTCKDAYTDSYSCSVMPHQIKLGHLNPNDDNYYDIFNEIVASPNNPLAMNIVGTYNVNGYPNLKFGQELYNDRWPYIFYTTNKALAYTAYNTSVEPTDPSYTYTAYTNSYSSAIIEFGFGDGYKGKIYVFGWSNYDDLINGKDPDLGASLHSTEVGLTYSFSNKTSVFVNTKLGFIDTNPDDKDVKDFTGIYFNDNSITKKNRGILWTNHTNQELMTAYLGTAHIGNEESSNYSYVCPLSDDGTIPDRYVQSLLDKITTLETENTSILERLEKLEAGSGTVTEKNN